ncbi:MAG: DUF1824 family protein [Microcoleaceae cyanobacterium]
MTPDSTSRSIQTAQSILAQFTHLEIQSQPQPENLDEIRQALLLSVNHCEYQMLGICADSLSEALAALTAYLTAFGYNIKIDANTIDPIQGSTYLKFNGRTQSYYARTYLEKYRGVLVSFQSSDEAEVSGTYGHFPLDLFPD